MIKKSVIIGIIIMVFVTSCQQTQKTSEESTTSEQTGISETSSETSSANNQWMQAINDKDMEALKELYTENALVVSENGIDVNGRDSLLQVVADNDFEVTSVTTTKIIEADKTYDYEIGSFMAKDGVKMHHLIIWNSTDGTERRELEFLAEGDDESVNLDVINSQRKAWMEASNGHDVDALIDSFYSENTMYYNKGKMLHGRMALKDEYQYMKNPQYQLVLEPMLVEPVNDHLVYEFGQCHGSYKGKYILIWQRNPEGVWQIVFDSNI